MGRWLPCLLLLASTACSDEFPLALASAPAPVPVVSAAVWPDALPRDVDPASSQLSGIRVYLDAGHGAHQNPGNTSSFCVAEQDFTYALADDVSAVLEELGMLVARSREGTQLTVYQARAAEAQRLGADYFVSLHSDVRGTPQLWSPDGKASCRRALDSPGFSVLYSDEGEPKLAGGRFELADQVARRMSEAGFLPYQGSEYEGLYEPVGLGDGVFVDRHEDNKRIFVLRRLAMPSIIVETHNALDPREAEQWETPLVRRAFALALARGIGEAHALRMAN